MAAHMFDLPETPSFPVYGLGDQFDGYRWLVVWNDRARLWTVTLGHGQPTANEVVFVSTFLKTPGLPTGGPTGYEDALAHAIHSLGNERGPRWAANQLNAVAWHGDDTSRAPRSLGPEWTSNEVIVDSAPVAAACLRAGHQFAMLIDLTLVVVAVTGPNDLMVIASSLNDMATRLSDYQ